MENTVLTNSIALIQSSIWPDDRFLRRSPERSTCYANLAAITRRVDREAMEKEVAENKNRAAA